MKILAPALLLLCLVVGGCDTDLDRDQALYCRLAAVALAGPDAALDILDERSSPPVNTAGSNVHIDYRAESAGLPRHTGFIDCTFAAGAERLNLVSVRTEAGPLSEPRLLVLNRFWLGDPDVMRLDPLPITGARGSVGLPDGFGYPAQQLVNAIPGAAVYALLAAAYSLVYGLIGRLNLAFGAFAAIGGAAALIAILGTAGWGVGAVLGIAFLAAVSCAAFHGIAIARLIFTPLHRSSGQHGLVATIGLALFLGEYLRLTQGAQPRWIGPILNTPFALAHDPGFVVTITPVEVLVSAVVATGSTALLLLMTYAQFGRDWRAFSDDPQAAALFGISRDRLFGQTFALASALAGLAGAVTVLFFGDLGFAYANSLGLKALTAAVLGGIGSVPGALLGGLFIGLVESGWSAFFPIVNRDLVVFCILIATLIWRPGGFLGFRDLTPRRV